MKQKITRYCHLLLLLLLASACKKEPQPAPQPLPAANHHIARAKSHVDSAMRQLGASSIAQKLGATINWEQAITDSANNVRVPMQVNLAKGLKQIENAINNDIFELFVRNGENGLEATIMHFIQLKGQYFPMATALDGKPKSKLMTRLALPATATGAQQTKGAGKLMYTVPQGSLGKADVLKLLSAQTGKNVEMFTISQCSHKLKFNPIYCYCDWPSPTPAPFEDYFIIVSGTDENGKEWSEYISYLIDIDPVEIIFSSWYPGIPLKGVEVRAMDYFTYAYNMGQEEISSTEDTKTMEYTWLFLTARDGSWRFASKERATFKKVNGLWVCNKLEHLGIEKSGGNTGWNLEVILRSAEPTINNNGAYMELMYNFKATPSTRRKTTTDIWLKEKSPVWTIQDNGGGGSSGGDSGSATEPVAVMPPPPKKPIADMEKFLSCFDKTQPANLTVYAEKIFSSFPGHAFISISQGNNTMIFGFYPRNNFPGILAGPGIMGDDSGHTYNGKWDIGNISSEKLQQIISLSVNYSRSDYDLTANNCADFTGDVLRTVGVTINARNVSTPNSIYNLMPASSKTAGRVSSTQRNCK